MDRSHNENECNRLRKEKVRTEENNGKTAVERPKTRYVDQIKEDRKVLQAGKDRMQETEQNGNNSFRRSRVPRQTSP